MIEEYKTIAIDASYNNALTQFNEVINSLIQKGWQPVGPAFMTSPFVYANQCDGPKWCQTMVKEYKHGYDRGPR